MYFNVIHNKTNIESWCQKVLDLLDLTFAELLYGITWNISLDISPLFLQMREEISEQFEQLVKLDN